MILRETSLRTWPLHFSHMGIDSTDVIALGRWVRPTSMMPMSAACCARKRYSMDWDFSAFRAYVAAVSLWMRNDAVAYHVCACESI